MKFIHFSSVKTPRCKEDVKALASFLKESSFFKCSCTKEICFIYVFINSILFIFFVLTFTWNK